jgi:hypothetical protein
MRSTALILIVFLTIIIGCHTDHSQYENDYVAKEGGFEVSSADGNGHAMRNDVWNGVLSSSAAKMMQHSDRKFIRSAQMKFRVDNIYSTSLAIEDMAIDFGGFVTGSNLNNRKTGTRIIPISKDSSLESITYEMSNRITFRVPNEHLDSLLRSMIQFVDYLDYRNIKVQDVTLNIKAHQLSQKRYQNHGRRLSQVSKRDGEMNEATSNAEAQLSADELRDRAIMNELGLEDQIAYSNVEINIYQREKVMRSLIANPKNIEAYEPGFFQKVGVAIVSGWNGFLSFIVGITHVWPVWVIAALAIVLIRMFRQKKS